MDKPKSPLHDHPRSTGKKKPESKPEVKAEAKESPAPAEKAEHPMAAMFARHASERDGLHKAHEAHRRELHGRHRTEQRSMHERHQTALAEIAKRHMARSATDG